MAEKKTAEDKALFIKGYRHKETLPLKLFKPEILAVVEGARLAVESGDAPEEALLNYVSKVLLEGREDAGTNSIDRNNKKSVEAEKRLLDKYDGEVYKGVRYGIAYREKQELAKRLGISFEEAWNGTGKSKDTKRTGKQHAQRAEEMRDAVNDPRNQELNDYVNSIIQARVTPTDRVIAYPYSAVKEVYGEGREQLYAAVAKVVENKVPVDPKASLPGMAMSAQAIKVNDIKKAHNLETVVEQGLSEFIRSKLSKNKSPGLPAYSDPDQNPYTTMQYEVLQQMADPVLKLIQEKQKAFDSQESKK